jgi:HEAT repeat protein
MRRCTRYSGSGRTVANRRIEEEVERLSKLRDGGPGTAATAGIRKALGDRTGLVVAKAAKVAVELDARELLPELLAAFDRMFEKPNERDPQCWAKNAIAKALTAMDYRESAPYLRGARHVQMEPVWGGQEDSATTLRGVCMLGLATCSDVRRETVFRVLVDGMADPSRDVRAEATRAVAEMGGDEAPLLLRLKARLGDTELPVVGQVFDSLLQLEGIASVAFMADLLERAPEDVRTEAALALGSSRLPEAVEALERAWETVRELELRYTIARAIGTSRLERGLAFLLRVVTHGRLAEARMALEALSLNRESPEIWRRVEQAVAEAGSAVQAEFRNLAAKGG